MENGGKGDIFTVFWGKNIIFEKRAWEKIIQRFTVSFNCSMFLSLSFAFFIFSFSPQSPFFSFMFCHKMRKVIHLQKLKFKNYNFSLPRMQALNLSKVPLILKFHKILFLGIKGKIKLLPPAIIKPKQLWSGKQASSFSFF